MYMQWKSRAIGSAAIVLAAAVTLMAQTPPPPVQEKQVAPKAAGLEVTVAGCLRDQPPADPAAAPPATQPSMAVADQFWLTNASIVGAKAGDATKPPDTVGTSGAAGLSYELTGEKEAELKTHLNKKVEIKGRLMSADPTAAAPTGSPRAAKVPRLTIESFKPLNEECPAK